MALALPEEIAASVRAAEEQIVIAARNDPAICTGYVLRDEETGGPIVMQPMHDEWHGLVSGSRRTLIWSHVEAAKTQQMSIGRVLWEIGRNHNIRVLIISNTDGQAQKIAGSLGKYIESSAELHAVFPDLHPDKTTIWTKHALTVQGRRGNPKDPTIQSCGIHGNILGSRLDLVIVDDILDYENALSPYQREDLARWWRATAEGRLTSNARVICVGTAWHTDDIMHRWSRLKSWKTARYPVINSVGKLSWPDKWPLARIEEKKTDLGPVEFSRQLMCLARSDEESRFKMEWIDSCRKRGENVPLVYSLRELPPGYRTLTGVDLSTGKRKDQGDLTTLFTIAEHPDETRQVLTIESGRWKGPEIISRIENHHRRYHSICVVENNASQEYILQFTRATSAVPVIPFTTGRNKLNPEHGIESLAVEMANAKWIIPCDPTTGRSHPEVEAWIQEMMTWDPRGHTGDRLMASWFAREGARIRKSRGRVGRLDLLTR